MGKNLIKFVNIIFSPRHCIGRRLYNIKKSKSNKIYIIIYKKNAEFEKIIFFYKYYVIIIIMLREFKKINKHSKRKCQNVLCSIISVLVNN